MLVKLKYHKEVYGEVPTICEIIINTRYIKRIVVNENGEFAILYDTMNSDWWIKCANKWEEVKHKFEII